MDNKSLLNPYLEVNKLSVLIAPRCRGECGDVGRKERRDSGCDLPGLSCHGLYRVHLATKTRGIEVLISKNKRGA